MKYQRMNLRTYALLILFFLISVVQLTAQQTYSIKGVVKDNLSGEPLPFVNVIIWNSLNGSVTAEDGSFTIQGVSPGSYRLQASFIGYKPFVTAEFRVVKSDVFVGIEMEESSQNLQEVNVVATPFRKTAESPLGLRVIGFKEIEKSAGGNRDISRVVQSFPGVASTAAFRNDIIVRGGGPSENRFFLDGVEIPNINHFSTQGASGGPVGIINPDFIREVNFYAAAFPAARGNALSSVLDFKLQDGNQEKSSARAVVGASEVAFSSNGPLGKKTTYLVSVRRSYLQFLFKAIGLPFLPTYTDAQFKIKHQIDKQNEISFIGLGALDDMKLNTGMKDMSDENKYILEYLPVVKQKTYTLGAVYKHFAGHNMYSLIASSSYMNNKNLKYKDNIEEPERLSLDYNSGESEFKLRSENLFRLPYIQLAVGGNVEYIKYTNESYQKIFTDRPFIQEYNASLGLTKWGLFATATYESYNERFTASLGLRTDANNYSTKMNNMVDQLSPRLSLSYRFYKDFYVNGNIGRFFELPAYTSMGFKDNQGEYINKVNGLQYIRSDQAGIGLEFRPKSYLKFTAEGFYKHYDRYPMSLTDSIPLASKGADYGVLGNEAVQSIATGRAYGLELMGRWYNYKGLTFIASYTLVRSEFKYGRNTNRYLPSSWDNKHLFTFSGTYSLPRNWDIGAKFRYVGGAPYTPYDLEKSSLVEAWDAKGNLYYDYSRFNSGRLKSFTQLDIRIDKSYSFKKWMLGLYLDIQNALNSTYNQPDVYIKTGKIMNPEAPVSQQRYELKPVKRTSGTLLPSIGIMIDF